jgi:hypothetical protein
VRVMSRIETSVTAEGQSVQAACAVWSLAYLCYRHYRGRRSPSYLSCGDEAQGSAKLNPKEGSELEAAPPQEGRGRVSYRSSMRAVDLA